MGLSLPTFCQLEQSGFFGWDDVVVWLLLAFFAGAGVTWKLLWWLHDKELLAAYEIGKRER